jgi:ACS family sodium-dependent inorganic phosphate cotransporter
MKVNGLDLCPNYSGTLMALVNGIGAFTGIFTPYIVGVLTPQQTFSQWRLVFWIVLAFFVVTNLIFVLFASGEVQEWNDPEFINRNRQKRWRDKREDTQIAPEKA